MALLRASIEEQPPPYTEASQPSAVPYPKPAEPLPEYSTRPSPSSTPIPSQTTRLGFIRRFWFYIALILLAIAGIIAGVVAHEVHKSSSSSSGFDPSNPAITSLTVAECDAGSFIIYRDTLGDFYLQGHLRNQTWNQTDVGIIPKTIIQVPPHGYGDYVVGVTNLTAVCWTDDIGIELRFYYISGFYNLNEGSLSFPLSSSRFPYYPVNLTANHHTLTNLTNPSSIAAVRHNTLGTRVFYLDSPETYWDVVEGYKPANVTEISWRTDDTVWDTQQEINILGGIAHDSGAALAAVAVETSTGSASDEIHVYYANSELDLESISYLNNSWQQPQTPSRGDNQSFPLSTHEIALSLSCLNPTNLSLWYIDSHKPQTGVSIITTPLNATNTISAPAISSFAPSIELPVGIQYPGLIAATSWPLDNNTLPQAEVDGAQNSQKIQMWQSLYYVQRYSDDGRDVVVGTIIANATTSVLTSGNFTVNQIIS